MIVRRIGVVIAVIAILGLASFYLIEWLAPESVVENSNLSYEVRIELPEPRRISNVSLEEAFLKRRSVRQYKDEQLTIQEVSQLLWAAQGITHPKGFRTALSAGALYPLEVYLVVGEVTNLTEGLYKYHPTTHEISKVLDGDKKAELTEAALEQTCVEEAAIDIVITAIYERTTLKYGDRGIRYVHMEAGHSAQNICLQATTLNLGTVTVGAFNDEQVKEALNLAKNEQLIYIIPVGKK